MLTLALSLSMRIGANIPQYGSRARLVRGYYFSQQPKHQVTIRNTFFSQHVCTVAEHIKLMVKLIDYFGEKVIIENHHP